METTPNHGPPVRPWALLLLALAGCRKSDPPPPPAPPVDAAPPSVSLLQTTPARLALEWQFETGADPFKGWKGKWFAVRIPSDAHVAAISLHVSEPTRASVSRDGSKLKEASIGGDGVIPIDSSGGDYRVELGEPRTISNLDVLGQPGASRKSIGGLPPVRFGSLDIGVNVSGPWPTKDVFCEKRGGERCLHDREDTLAHDRSGEYFALHTKLGWFVILDAKEVERGTAHAEAPEAGLPYMRFVHVDRNEMRMGFEGEALKTHVVATRELVVCRGLGDFPDCDDRRALGTWVGDVGLGVTPFPPPSGKWNEPKAPRFLADGGVIVE